MIYEDNSIRCCFVMSKNRVAPLKKTSIVRLEMQAAVLAIRLADNIKKEVTCSIDETFYWSDSKVVLCYLQNEGRRFHEYIAVRVTEIRDSSSPNQWRHIPGRDNPADEASRGLTASKLTPDSRWFHGPTFLHNSEDTWPSSMSHKCF